MMQKLGAKITPRDQFALTPVEQRVWDLHQQGKKVAEIAAILEMKAISVSRRLTTIREKKAAG